MKPKDVRVLRVNCDHSEGGKWRVHLFEEEWKALSESYDRIFQDRYDLLTVHTKEGMLASEWVMRTATAERERDEERAEAERWRNAHHEASIRLQAHDCGEEAAKLYERAGRAEEAVQKLGAQLDQAERELDEAHERAALAEQRALDAECERDACRGMEQAAEMRAERLFRDRALVDERARKAAQLLIAEVGADRPMNVEEAAEAAVKEINRLRRDYDRIADAMGLADWAEGQGFCHVAPFEDVIDAAREYQRLKSEVERLQWSSDMACENTPNPKCECPGCETARERAEKGEVGP